MHTEPDDLPTASFPANTQLSLMNFPDQEGHVERFSDVLSGVLIALSRFLDLERLAGVTAGYDFDAAVMSVDLGFESKRAREYTNDGDFVCVGKAMNVIRDGRPMSHVVYNANVIEPILDADHPDHELALHIIAHELGHVVELKWRDDAMPGVMLSYRSPDFVSSILLQIATSCWEEYAACRLTAIYGDKVSLLNGYASNLDGSIREALPRSREAIKLYRDHADLQQLLVEAGRPLATPFKLMGYFLGHADGIEADPASVFCPHLAGSIYDEILAKVHCELRKIWDTRSSWQGIGIFDGICKLATDCYGAAGMEISEQTDGGHFVKVPFTAETMPNGQADMMLIELERLARKAACFD